MVIALGLLNVVTALALLHSKGSVLSMWFAVSAIASGGLGGLFLLAFLLPRATRAGAYAGIVSSMLFTIWAVLTKSAKPVLHLSPFNFPYDELTIGAFGNIILFAIGLAASLITPAEIRRRDDRAKRRHSMAMASHTPRQACDYRRVGKESPRLVRNMDPLRE
jgi:solute:Na+ symporter, SSS family